MGPDRISAGGMGEVYRVQDSMLRRDVAVKLLAERFARDRGVRARFLREANAAAKLSGHPHVVTIYDVGEWGGRPYIVMEYLANGDLRAQLARGRPAPRTSVRWIGEAASALDAAHRRGVIHRDIKPANLLLDDRWAVRVADFGIARVVDETATSMTLPGTVMGTAGYISPEQARGEPATAASDIYSLAAVAYELITGRRPYERESQTDEIAAHLHEPLAPASRWSAVPASVDRVFQRALAKDPRQRYDTAEGFAAELDAALQTVDQPTIVAAARNTNGNVDPIRTYRASTTRTSRWTGRLWLAGVALATSLIGLAAAYQLTAHTGKATVETVTRQHTVERVITHQGKTVTVPQIQTDTITVSTSAAPPPPPPPPSPDAAAAHRLNDQGYADMQRGSYADALAPLRQAVRDLRGAGPADPYEAYANYNLGYTLLQLGHCNQAIPPLERAERLETSPAVPAALARARACA